MSTFLPAQALRTSRKTGGLNSRPSCVRDGTVSRRRVLCSLSRLVSRFGRARANDRFAVSLYVRRAKHVRLVPQPSRDGAARAVRRLLCGRDTAACMDLHIRDRIPGFHHGCDRARTFRGWRLRFAALWPARVPHCNEQCQPSEGEALLNWSNSVEASTRHRTRAETTATSTPARVLGYSKTY